MREETSNCRENLCESQRFVGSMSRRRSRAATRTALSLSHCGRQPRPTGHLLAAARRSTSKTDGFYHSPQDTGWHSCTLFESIEILETGNKIRYTEMTAELDVPLDWQHSASSAAPTDPAVPPASSNGGVLNPESHLLSWSDNTFKLLEFLLRNRR